MTNLFELSTSQFGVENEMTADALVSLIENGLKDESKKLPPPSRSKKVVPIYLDRVLENKATEYKIFQYKESAYYDVTNTLKSSIRNLVIHKKTKASNIEVGRLNVMLALTTGKFYDLDAMAHHLRTTVRKNAKGKTLTTVGDYVAYCDNYVLNEVRKETENPNYESPLGVKEREAIATMAVIANGTRSGTGWFHTHVKSKRFSSDGFSKLKPAMLNALIIVFGLPVKLKAMSYENVRYLHFRSRKKIRTVKK